MEISSNRRILKNTIYLYLRMIVSMGVTLYTSRVVLDVLGASDYGIYSVIGGIVVIISILNSSMSEATQRFITFELGTGDLKKVSDTFSMSMTAHYLLSIVVLVLGETVGLYYVNNYLNVPPERHSVAFWVFQLSLLTVITNFVRIPYNASVIAYEKMNFFAIISIVEVTLKLVLVLLLTLIPSDKLILYAVLIFLNTFICNLIYRSYCRRKFSTCNYYWFIDKSSFKKLFSFFGWNIVGGIATSGTHQVGNIMMNAFCGPIINAAYGVASQVSNALYTFSTSFETAYTPQIVKLYAQNNRQELFRLMNRSSLLSYYLLFIIAMPIFLNIDYVLGLWLKEVPSYAGIFSQWLIIYFLIDAIQAPLWKLITATGNIKAYEIWLSLILLFNIPLSFICLKNGLDPVFVLVISATLNFITAIIRTIHVKIQSGFPVSSYLAGVVLRAVAVTGAYLLIWKLLSQYFSIYTFLKFVIFFIVSSLVFLSLVYTIGIGKNDRIIIEGEIKKRVFKKQSV